MFTPPTWLTVAIFVASYALIAARRLSWLPIGRPAGALVGAVAMVASGSITPRESYAAVDADTIVLLFGMMLLTAYLERAGLFEALTRLVLARAATPRALLTWIALVAGGLSALLVNDTVCLFLTPVVVMMCRQGGLPFGPYLIALATSANIGCAATLVGNPQNMLIGTMSGLSFARFAVFSVPTAAAALGAHVLLLHRVYARALPERFMRDRAAPVTESRPMPAPGSLRLTLAVTVVVVGGFLAGLHLGYTVLAGVAVLMVWERVEPIVVFARLDWTLLVFFASLFVLVGAIEKTGLPAWAWTHARPFMSFASPGGLAAFVALVVAGSNIVSNVPLVLLTGPQLGALGAGELGWLLLAFASTVAGNLTLVGSAANIIVAERAKADYALGFREYLRVGAPACLLSALVGVAVMVALHRALG